MKPPTSNLPLAIVTAAVNPKEHGDLDRWSEIVMQASEVLCRENAFEVVTLTSPDVYEKLKNKLADGVTLVSTPSGYTPRGALASAVLAATQLEGSTARPLVIIPGDTILSEKVTGYLVDFLCDTVEGAVVVFECTGVEEGNWSYVHTDFVDGKTFVTRITEGESPSKLLTAGVFLFRSVDTFMEAAKWCFVNYVQTKGQYYSSSALNYLVSNDKYVKTIEIGIEDFEKWRNSN